MQVTSTTLEGGTLKIKVDEVVVNDINLRFENRKSGEVRAEGKTKPDVILRHILSQPGKVRPQNPALKDRSLCLYLPRVLLRRQDVPLGHTLPLKSWRPSLLVISYLDGHALCVFPNPNPRADIVSWQSPYPPKEDRSGSLLSVALLGWLKP